MLSIRYTTQRITKDKYLCTLAPWASIGDQGTELTGLSVSGGLKKIRTNQSLTFGLAVFCSEFGYINTSLSAFSGDFLFSPILANQAKLFKDPFQIFNDFRSKAIGSRQVGVGFQHFIGSPGESLQGWAGEQILLEREVRWVRRW